MTRLKTLQDEKVEPYQPALPFCLTFWEQFNSRRIASMPLRNSPIEHSSNQRSALDTLKTVRGRCLPICDFGRQQLNLQKSSDRIERRKRVDPPIVLARVRNIIILVITVINYYRSIAEAGDEHIDGRHLACRPQEELLHQQNNS